jgi:hypothetical protein
MKFASLSVKADTGAPGTAAGAVTVGGGAGTLVAGGGDWAKAAPDKAVNITAAVNDDDLMAVYPRVAQQQRAS